MSKISTPCALNLAACTLNIGLALGNNLHPLNLVCAVISGTFAIYFYMSEK